ncbi:MAG: hypothetical protein LQ349_003598 [Xanthoria aureola]|nr:MAG: hypothetical protein LQ349_003598 [Xanthoria aureola]
MSGAEAIAVLGIIASTPSIIDFTSKILERIKEAGENVHNIPKAFRDVQITLPLLSHALKQTKQRINSGDLDEEACAALKPVLQDCKSGISELNDIFGKCLPKDGSSRFHRGWKAAISLRKDKKVEEISELLQKRVSFLTYHHVATPSSSAMDSVSTAMAALEVKEAKRPKTYSLIPVQWAEDFTGREEQLSDLSSKLSQPGKHTRVAIVGLGGIGKTRLVRQYIETQKNTDLSVFWIHAGSAERMKSGSRDIANVVGIQGCDGPDVDILQKVKEWFESEASGRWLLVYDNVDDIDLMYGEAHGRLASYFPRSIHGAIIMTTRNKQVGIKFATAKNLVPLSTLTDAESLALMATKLGDDDSETTNDLKELAEVLGGISLAIIQAISFIEENGSTPARYLELYRANDSNKIELLSEDFEDDTRDLELKNPIASTWMVTFDYMKARQPLAADTLCMMSMFDAQAIPEALISKTAGGDSNSSTSVEKTLGILQAYSLISPRDVTGVGACIDQIRRLFDLHRLVRLVTRSWLTMCSTYNHWVANAIDVMSIRYDELGRLKYEASNKVMRTYLPHASSLMSSPPLFLKDDEEVVVPDVFHGQTLQDDHAEYGVICPTCTGNILRQISERLSLVQALRMVKKGAAICTFSLGANHILTLPLRFRVATIRSLVGEYNGAEVEFKELRMSYGMTFGPRGRATLEVEMSLADTLRNQGKYGEAESLLIRLQEVSCQEYGQEDPLSLSIMQALATLMITQDRNEEAYTLISEISKLVETADSKIALARTYLLLSRYSEAETLLMSLLEDEHVLRREGCFEEVLMSLAQTFYDQGLFDKAAELRRQILFYDQQVYGEDHLVTKLNLGETLYHLGQYHEAETLLLEANKSSDVLTSGKLRVLTYHARWYIAKVRLKLGKCDQSKELALKTINWIKEERGAQHGYYIGMKEDLAQIWGINPDGTPFEGSVELGTDESPNECGTDNLSEGAVENTGQHNAEQQ